jgi:peroxiredoxin
MRTATVLLLAGLLTAPVIQKAIAQNLSGRRAPSFSLPDSAFKQFDILDYRGRWLVINFTRMDCPECKEFGRRLQALQTKLGNRVAVLNIVLTPPENQQTVAKYVADTKITSPILFDMSLVAMAYFKRTPQNASFDSPHIFAVNPQGNIVRDWNQGQVGNPATLTELEQLVTAAAK